MQGIFACSLLGGHILLFGGKNALRPWVGTFVLASGPRTTPTGGASRAPGCYRYLFEIPLYLFQGPQTPGSALFIRAVAHEKTMSKPIFFPNPEGAPPEERGLLPPRR